MKSYDEQDIDQIHEDCDGHLPSVCAAMVRERLRLEPVPPKVKTQRRARFAPPQVLLPVRVRLHHAYGSRCVYCLRTEELDLDFLVPPCREGTSRETNLVVACERCRDSRRTRHLDAWLERRLELDDHAVYARIARATVILRRAHEPLRRAA